MSILRRLAVAFVTATMVGCTNGAASPGVTTAPSMASPSPSPAASAVAAASPTAAGAGPFDPELVSGFHVEVDMPITTTVSCGGIDCIVPIDVLAPASGANLPTYVLVPGGPQSFSGRRYMDVLAASIARRGGVVFLTSYRSESTGNTRALSGPDVRCAVRVARAQTMKYGGDPNNVILVGHSVGSQLVLGIGTTPDSATPDCLADGDGAPEAVVGLAGFDQVAVPSSTGDAPPLWLGGAEIDGYSVAGPALAKRLADAGFTVEYQLFLQARHEDMVDPAYPGLLELILKASSAGS